MQGFYECSDAYVLIGYDCALVGRSKDPRRKLKYPRNVWYCELQELRGAQERRRSSYRAAQRPDLFLCLTFWQRQKARVFPLGIETHVVLAVTSVTTLW
jgi:hypothetical protein